MFLFLIVVVSLACGSVPPHPMPLSLSLLGPTGLVLLWLLLAKAVADLAVVQVRSGIQPPVAVQRLHKRLEFLRWLGAAAVFLCLLGCGLAGAVQTWPLFSQSLLLQGIVLLTPGLALIACTLWAEHRYHAAMGDGETGVLVAAGATGGSLSRMALWLVAPIMAMLAALDLLTRIPWAERVSPGIGVAALTLLIAPVLVPWMVKRLWPTRPLDAAEHHWIRDLVASAGVSRLDLRLWNTGMRSSNAVVVGFFPGLRSLLLTDRLVRDLPAEQLKLIVLHEIAHIRRSHIWVRILSVFPGWMMAAGILHVYGTSPSMLLLSHAAAILLTLVMLRLSAHETEFDADRAACRLAMQITDPAIVPQDRTTDANFGQSVTPGSYPTEAHSAAARMADALRGVTDPGHGHRASWLHPSVDARCQRLRHWADNVAH